AQRVTVLGSTWNIFATSAGVSSSATSSSPVCGCSVEAFMGWSALRDGRRRKSRARTGPGERAPGNRVVGKVPFSATISGYRPGEPHCMTNSAPSHQRLATRYHLPHSACFTLAGHALSAPREGCPARRTLWSSPDTALSMYAGLPKLMPSSGSTRTPGSRCTGGQIHGSRPTESQAHQGGSGPEVLQPADRPLRAAARAAGEAGGVLL